MTDKISLTSLANLENETTAVSAINANNASLTTAINNTLSRDGTSPNTMGAGLDMNGYQILNLPAPTTNTSPLRFSDLNSFLGGSVTFSNMPTGGTTGQMLAKNSNSNYDAGWLSAVTATTFNKVTITAPATAATFTLADGKTLTVNNTITLNGTDATVLTLPTTSDTLASFARANAFTAANSFSGVITSTNTSQSGSTLTGSVILAGGLGVAKAAFVDRLGAANGIGVGGLSPAPSTTWINIAAGTTAVAPITFASGTNLTTAAIGAMEFDGNAFYTTPVASNRGVNTSAHLMILSSDYTMSNVNTAQKCFNATTNGALTLPASTSYEFEAVYLISNTGTTSHTWSVLFGGTATFTSIAYKISGLSSTATTPATGTLFGSSNVATAIVVTGAQTSATEQVTIHLRGIMRINGTGTVIPQIQMSAAPGGAQKMLTNSFFRCWPVGTNSATTVGNWS